MSAWKKFKNIINNYINSTSLPGVKYLDKSFPLIHRYVWGITELCLVIWTLILLYSLTNEFLQNPTFTSLESQTYRVKNIKFPGIAICDNNKISREKALFLANKLYNESYTKINKEKIMEFILQLSIFYDINLNRISPGFLKFYNSYIKLYENRYPDTKISYYLLKELAPSCNDLLEKCFWEDIEYNCSELFEMKTTYEGFCCMFNYLVDININNESLHLKTARKVRITGIENGLRLFLNNKVEDYFYQLIPTTGIKVHIFNPYSFPDSSSGEIVEVICPAGAEAFLAVEAKTIISVPDVQHYPKRIRQCVFQKEVFTPIGRYSYSNCLTTCKLKSMLALCQCVPFTVATNYENISFCSLEQMTCVNKYKSKWDTIYPKNEYIDGLDHEKEDSLHCPECFPGCSETSYIVFTNFSPLETSRNSSIIRIYFKSDFSLLYVQDVVYYWYEMLSTFGGLFGILLGGSLMTLVELIYFVTIHIFLKPKII